jgi:hypothetical protein
MSSGLAKVTYQGFRIGEGWEVVVRRPGQRLRLLDPPRDTGDWALSILTDYLGDEGSAKELQNDFASLTLRRFTGDWELCEGEIDSALMEVQLLRLRWRAVMARS